jgi:HK97 family phage major capsid protein/HK97 family phage prohead protease
MEEQENIEPEVTLDTRVDRANVVQRAISMESPGIDADARRITVGVSTEEPVQRSFGLEVIDHSAASMDLTFLRSGRAPLLLDHDMTKVIGVVEGVELDEDSRRLRAIVRFGKGSLASEVFDDCVDGIRRNISVGYELNGRVERKDDPEEYYRVKTRPLEVSIVSIPADSSDSVGVGRSHPPVTSPQTQERTENMENMEPHVDVEAAKADAVRASRENDKSILSLAARFNRRDLGEAALGRGLSVEQFRGELLTDIEQKQALDIAPMSNDVKPKEQRAYSLGALVRAQVSGDWKGAGMEREMHEEIVRRTGKESQGYYVPDFAWRSGVMTTAATGAISGENITADFVPTVQRGDLFIEALRARQVLGGLGVNYMGGLTNRIRIPRLSGAQASFVEEAGNVTDQSQTDSSVVLEPRTFGAFVEISRLLAMESVPSIEQVIRNDLLNSMADRLEYYAINGTGSGGQPTGLLNTAGVGNLDISADGSVADLTWADLVALVKIVEAANGVISPNALGWLSHPAVKAKMASTAKVSGTDSIMLLNEPWNAMYGYRASFSSNVPTDLDPGDGGNDASALVFGDYSQMMIGLFNAPSILVNPYAGDKSGTVRITVLQEVDVAVRNGESFAKTDEVNVA